MRWWIGVWFLGCALACGDNAPPALPEVAPFESPLVLFGRRGDEHLRATRDASAGVSIGLRGRDPLRVIEEAASGAVRWQSSMLVHRHAHGASVWTVGPDDGFEEWLVVEEGLAFEDRSIARWRVPGHALRAIPGGVHVLGDDGRPVAFVSAPAAYTRAGREVPARVGVERDRLALYVDANGESVIADPLWVAAGVMLRSRREFYQGHGLEPVPGGAVAIGGYDGVTLASAERFDEATETWSEAGTMAVSRMNHSTTLLETGEIFVAGGSEVRVPSPTPSALRAAERYDPSTNEWTTIAPMAIARDLHTATLLRDGSVLVVGGRGSPSASLSAERYDPTSGTWTTVAPPSVVHQGHTATLLASGEVLVVGGYPTSAVVEIYDPATDRWRTLAGAPRYGHTATTLDDGRVLFVGGRSAVGMVGAAANEIFDPATELWTRASPAAATEHTTTALPSGALLLVADESSYIYFPSVDRWRTGPRPAHRRRRHMATRLGSGRVLVAGPSIYSELFVDDEVCGNGELGTGEECDDGNTIDGDCCSSSCRIEPASTICGAARRPCEDAPRCDGRTDRCPAVGMPLAAGTPCGGVLRGPCDAPDVCDGVSATRCLNALYPAGTECSSSSCEDGVETLASACDGDSPVCVEGEVRACAGYVCGPSACLTACGASSDCASGFFCSESARCEALRVQGAACGSSAQCASGFCVDGRCCDRACDGSCEACDVVAEEGQCVVVVGAPHGDRAACGTDGSSCGGQCDGTASGCSYPPIDTPCGDARCSEGEETSAPRCDGAGACSAGTRRACGPFACGPASCRTSCEDDADCAPGFACEGLSCVGREPLDTGLPDAGLDGRVDLDGGTSPDAGTMHARYGCGCAATPSPRGHAILALVFVISAWTRARGRRATRASKGRAVSCM